MTYGIVYLAGPMTSMPDYNYPAFDAAEIAWKERGWLVESPTRSGRDWGFGKPYAFYMRQSFTQLLRANTIALLPGWESSPGAVLEYQMASALGYPVFDAVTFEPMPEYAIRVDVILVETSQNREVRLATTDFAAGSAME